MTNEKQTKTVKAEFLRQSQVLTKLGQAFNTKGDPLLAELCAELSKVCEMLSKIGNVVK